jgi:ABC-2 type transport system ATP-binding protein
MFHRCRCDGTDVPSVPPRPHGPAARRRLRSHSRRGLDDQPAGVLGGIDLRVPPGSVFALLGPNGAGKTTTVRILATLSRADAGRARVAGFDVDRDRRQVRRHISLTGQFAALDAAQTGEENLRMIGRLVGLPRAAARRRAAELLEQFDLAPAAGRRVGTYSGGLRRRLDLAASLTGRPAVIFLDEPTTGLDPQSRLTTWRAISGLAADGVTVFLTTQYLDEADRLADQIAVLNAGLLVAAGTAAELKRRVAPQRLDLTCSTTGAYGFARHQPATPVTETLRGLLLGPSAGGPSAAGQPPGGQLAAALVWSAVILAASVLLSMVLFRRRTA